MFVDNLFDNIAEDEPLPPLALRGDVRRGSVALAWEPASMPLTSIKSYVIERREEPTYDWSRVAALPPSTTRYTVPEVEEGRKYMFRIYTETTSGYSRPVEYEAPVYASAPKGSY